MALAQVEKLGGLDILVNAAGVLFDGDIQHTMPQDFDYLIDINLRCALHMNMILKKNLKKIHGCFFNV